MDAAQVGHKFGPLETLPAFVTEPSFAHFKMARETDAGYHYKGNFARQFMTSHYVRKLYILEGAVGIQKENWE